MAETHPILHRLLNQEVQVTMTHPPALGPSLGRIALLPGQDPLAQELLDACAADLKTAGSLVLVDREEVAAAAQGCGLAAPVVQDLGRRLNATTLVDVEDVTLGTVRTPLQKRMAWKDEDGTLHARTTHTARTQVRLRATFRAADCRTGRIFPAHALEAAPSLENHSTSGDPFFPSEADVRERAFAQLLAQARRMFLPWTETRELVFFDDQDYGMNEAYELMERQEHAAARHHSLEVLKRAKADAHARPKHLCRAHHNAGICLFVQGDFSAALPYFQVAQDLDPVNGIFREAAAECQRALRFFS